MVIRKKVFHPEGGWRLKQAPQGSGNSPKPDRAQEALDNVLRHRVRLLGCLVQSQELDLMFFGGHFQPESGLRFGICVAQT